MSGIGEEVEELFLAHCTIACDLSLELLVNTLDLTSILAVSHNNAFMQWSFTNSSLFDYDDEGEPIEPIAEVRNALAWVRALHYCADDSERTKIPASRLDAAIPTVTDGPASYDVAWAVQTGAMTANEARRQFGMLPAGELGYVTTRLHHSRILREVDEHLTYRIVNASDETVTEAYIHRIEIGIQTRTAKINLKRVGT